MTQSQLGAAIGVTYQQIQKYEKGGALGTSRMFLICVALGVPVSALFDPLELAANNIDCLNGTWSLRGPVT
jgi:transcriptional regulator with XRE-family HTH domain